MVRPINEDAILAEPPVFVVADGMGGHAKGEVASRIAIETFVDLVDVPALTAADAVAAIGRANEAILRSAEAGPERAGMGTTVTGLTVVSLAGSEHWLVFNVGDSRVYRLQHDQLTQITVDHSEVEEMVAAGQITREEARIHENRNIITRSLGTYPAPEPDSWVFPPEAGERFVVCTDGLNNELTDAEIAAIASEHPDPMDAARELVSRAVAAGGRDNVSAIVVDGPRSELSQDLVDTLSRA